MVEVVGALPASHLRRDISIECKASITGWPGGIIFGTRTDGLLVAVAQAFGAGGFLLQSLRLCLGVWLQSFPAGARVNRE